MVVYATLSLLLLLLLHISGSQASLDKRLFNLPNLQTVPRQKDPLEKETRYCFHFTWLGGAFDNNTFYKVKNRTCFEYFGKDENLLCIDPMAVTFGGRKPNLTYILEKHAEQATSKMTEDQVCAKYTIYYNGIPSHVVRYNTRIDVVSEGPMQSGCYTQRNGSYAFEVCACKSGFGAVGICNGSSRFSLHYTFPLLALICATMYGFHINRHW